MPAGLIAKKQRHVHGIRRYASGATSPTKGIKVRVGHAVDWGPAPLRVTVRDTHLTAEIQYTHASALVHFADARCSEGADSGEHLPDG